MKNISVCLLMIVMVTSLKSQDTIFKTNGNVIIAKILEINNQDVKFNYYNNAIDYVGIENKLNIHHITYSNGLKEFYNTSVALPVSATKEDVNAVKYGKNIIAVNFFETLFTNFGFSYERIMPNKIVALKIPFSFGLGGRPDESKYEGTPDNTDYLRNKTYGTGLELYIYPLKAARHGFYIGLTTEYGKFNYYQYIYSDIQNTQLLGKVKHEGTHLGGLFHIGGYVGLTDHILMGGKLALGYKRQETIFDDYTNFKAV
ncbi:MAG: hypothetical protein JNL69_07950, partial [Bacteroidia bacterium]|nr:hypothetical protein [Bacteroidia bacterium]